MRQTEDFPALSKWSQRLNGCSLNCIQTLFLQTKQKEKSPKFLSFVSRKSEINSEKKVNFCYICTIRICRIYDQKKPWGLHQKTEHTVGGCRVQINCSNLKKTCAIILALQRVEIVSECHRLSSWLRQIFGQKKYTTKNIWIRSRRIFSKQAVKKREMTCSKISQTRFKWIMIINIFKE